MIGMFTFDNITTAKYGKPESQHKVVFFELVYNVLRKSKQ
jgi:hypothetical protein